MARKKDLGSLAALAGLAYMASRDKAAESEKEHRSDPFGAMTQEERDARRDMNGRTVADENYGNESRRPIRASTRASTPSVDMREPVHVDAEAGMTRGTRPRPAAQVASTTAEGMRNYVPRRSAAQQIAGRDDTYNPDVGYRTRTENKDVSDMAYKKGGSVKGWGIARGARKAKTY